MLGIFMLSKSTVEKLRKTIEEEYGEKLTTQEAAAIANSLVGYFDLLAKIWHRKKIKNEKNESTPSN